MYSAPAHAEVVGRFVQGGQTARLTQAALETLAVIAYRQPVSRGQVSAVRGVNVDGVVRTLVARGLVAEVGQTRTPAPASSAPRGTSSSGWASRRSTSSPLAPHLPDMDDLEGLDGLADLRAPARPTGVAAPTDAPGAAADDADGAPAPTATTPGVTRDVTHGPTDEGHA